MKMKAGILITIVGIVLAASIPAEVNTYVFEGNGEQRESQKVLADSINVITHQINQVGLKGDLIEEYTWAVMRYDHTQRSVNFGDIEWPEPSPGVILVPANVISPELCRVALQIHDINKMETLNTLVDFDEKNMMHMTPALLPRIVEWNSPGVRGAYRKDAAHEMFCLGERCISPWANVVGDCYALSSFNTAVLRLCGFEPDEVFTVLINGHAVNTMKCNGKWYVIDPTLSSGVRKGYFDTVLFEKYNESEIFDIYNMIFGVENDRYFVRFGWRGADICSNMDGTMLLDIFEGVLPAFDYPIVGAKNWDIEEFVKEAGPNPYMINVSLPYTVEDAIGGNIDEKADFLSHMNYEFIRQQAMPEESPNQYNKALYAYNLMNVSYPQAYANAAKFAAWTSWLGDELDAKSSCKDISRTVNWIRLNIRTDQILNRNQIAFSDFPYIMRKGSTFDQAVMAYGTLRNMDKDDDFWQPEDLYVLVTENYEGYLAVNGTEGWEYLNFGVGDPIVTDPPDNPKMVFNEIESLGIWER